LGIAGRIAQFVCEATFAAGLPLRVPGGIPEFVRRSSVFWVEIAEGIPESVSETQFSSRLAPGIAGGIPEFVAQPVVTRVEVAKCVAQFVSKAQLPAGVLLDVTGSVPEFVRKALLCHIVLILLANQLLYLLRVSCLADHSCLSHMKPVRGDPRVLAVSVTDSFLCWIHSA
jgi:hypothetical protein